MKLTACVKHTSLKVILCYCKGSTQENTFVDYPKTEHQNGLPVDVFVGSGEQEFL